MTVKELLMSVSIEDLVIEFEKNGLLDEFKDKDIYTEKRTRLKNNITKTIAEIKNTKPIYDPEYNDFVVFVKSYKDDLCSIYQEPDTYYEVCGYHIKDLISKKHVLDVTWDNLKKQEEFIISYGLDFLDRSIIAPLDVCQLSIDKYGIKKVAAEVLYEITFYGWEESQIKERSKELDESIKEANEHPELLRPIEDLFEELDWKDERTKEEQEADFNYSMMICEENYYDSNDFLKEYIKKYC